MAQNSFINTFVRNTSDDERIESVQNSLENSFRSIESCPLLDGHLLEGIELPNGITDIDHKLGRALKGWFLTRTRNLAGGDICDKQSLHNIEDRILRLSSTYAATITVDIWVF
jgi:hypothetical protein